VEPVREGFELDLIELLGHGEQRVPEARGFEEAYDQVAGPDLGLPEEEGSEHPGTFHSLLHLGREVGDGGGASGEPVQRIGQVLGEPRRVEPEVLEDAVEVRVLELEELMEPVGQLHVRVAAELAEDRGALDGPVTDGVELTEEGDATDLGHGTSWEQA
jgi:hypothetical protein